MKKLFITFILLYCFGASAVAQTEKGSKLIGGTGTFHINTDDEEGLNSFIALTPRIGFFVANNVALGTAVPLLYSFSDNSSSSLIGITPFARGYFGSTATRFLLEARVGYSRQSYEFEDGPFEDSEEEDGVNYGVGIGLAHFLNEHVGLEALISYDHSEQPLSPFEYSNFNGINFNIGLQFYLPRKQ